MQGYLTFGGGEDAVHLVQLHQQRFTFGSDERMDLAVTVAGLPGYCGSFTWDHERGSWALETDAAARSVMKLNGMPLMQPAVMLEDGAVVSASAFTMRFDLLPQIPTVSGQELRVIPLSGTQMRIGRGNEEADPAKIVLDAEDGDVSRHHATLEFEATERSWYLRDHSHAGTELNGQAFERERLVIGDRFRIGHYVFEFTGRSLRRLPTSSAGRIVGRGLTRVVGDGRRILNEVSMDVPPGSFVGLLGGSGQGKSTLMTAMCGLNPPTSGEVLLNGVKIGPGAKSEAAGVGRIGFVPQDDIVHVELTVHEAITFSARLRLPDDPAASEVEALVMATAKRLSLEPHLHKRVFQLSGGQRKRVSIATEMLMKPAVLFLDEPSSGLDPATEFYLMETLRLLAGTDCTVICTTHVLGFAHLFDRVTFVQGGRVVYYGRPDDAAKFFERSEWVDIYLLLDKSGKEGQKDPSQWEADYQASSAKPEPEPNIPLVHDQGAAPPASRPGLWRTLATLMGRQWAILKADKMNLAFLGAQAAAIALMIGWVASGQGLRSFLSVVAVLWFGCSNAAQQIVGELPIFRRERVCGLGLHVYLLSKILFCFATTLLQAALLFVTVTLTALAVHGDAKQWSTDRAALLEDKRLVGDTSEIEAEDTPGAGALTLGKIFGFSRAEAEAIAGAFALRSEKGEPLLNDEGQPLLDERTVTFHAESLARELSSQTVLKTDAARREVQLRLKPGNVKPVPPRELPAVPGMLYREGMLLCIRFLGLKENVIDSAERYAQEKGEDIVDVITGRRLKHAAKPLYVVVLLPLALHLLALAGTALVGVALGLAISALVRSPTQAVMWVPLLLIPQILFGGFMVTLPEMGTLCRRVSHFVPSSAAQRIAEAAAVYGQRVPLISNRSRIPIFMEGYETVTWGGPTQEKSEDYQRVSPVNTALQNLIVKGALSGKREKEKDADGNELESVETRADIAPYVQAMPVTDLSPVRRAGLVLLGWVLLCYLISLQGLKLKQPN
ncbi:MAG: hypothetical protein B7Z37_21365 [Verrucomicrobia bacterium 12-59-8]|nr:MAG: hypothetical protein B7Z37_21365 [Verrucomicrobia bacterium 12-59-8]